MAGYVSINQALAHVEVTDGVTRLARMLKPSATGRWDHLPCWHVCLILWLGSSSQAYP